MRAHEAMGGDGGDRRGREEGFWGEGDDGGEIGCGCVGLVVLGRGIGAGSGGPLVTAIVVGWTVLEVEVLERGEADVGWEVAMSHGDGRREPK